MRRTNLELDTAFENVTLLGIMQHNCNLEGHFN